MIGNDNETKTDMLQYNVPTGEKEEEAIALRALKSKDHKDFENCKYLLNLLHGCQLNYTQAKTLFVAFIEAFAISTEKKFLDGLHLGGHLRIFGQ